MALIFDFVRKLIKLVKIDQFTYLLFNFFTDAMQFSWGGFLGKTNIQWSVSMLNLSQSLKLCLGLRTIHKRYKDKNKCYKCNFKS